MISRWLWLNLLAFSFCHLCFAQAGSKPQLAAPLERELSRIRQEFPGNMAIYMKNLASGDEIALDADSVYETFSVIKLAIAAEVLRQSEAGKFSLADRIAVVYRGRVVGIFDQKDADRERVGLLMAGAA